MILKLNRSNKILIFIELDKYIINLDTNKIDHLSVSRAARSRNMKTISTTKDKMMLDLNVYDSNSFIPVVNIKSSSGHKLDNSINLRKFRLRENGSNLGRTKTLPEIGQLDIKISKSRLG